MLGSVPNSAIMLGRYLLNSVSAGQMTAEFSEYWTVAYLVKKKKRELVTWIPIIETKTD